MARAVEEMMTKLGKEYLAIRRASGYELRNWGSMLMSFARFADARGDTHVRVSTAHDWAALGRTPPQRERRLQLVIRFAKYVRDEDERNEVPLPHVFSHCTTRRPTPFIFTADLLCRFLEEAGKLGPRGSLRPHTYQTLFGLLSASGLRISEALALKLDDLTPDGLVIRKTKFRKTRLVPVCESVIARLDQYLQRRLSFGSEYVFVTQHGQRVPYERVRRAFHRVLLMAGIERQLGKPRPVVHSFRHGFAVRALETCPHDPAHIARHMVALSTYLGHVNVSSTYWYLQATPRVMTDIAEASEAFVYQQTMGAAQ
jgi:integrase